MQHRGITVPIFDPEFFQGVEQLESVVTNLAIYLMKRSLMRNPGSSA